MKRILSVLLSLTLLLCILTVSASEKRVAEKYQETASHLLTCPTPQVGYVGGEWLVIGLARAEMLPLEMANGYYQNVVSYVRNRGSAKLDRSKATDNARVILALTAIDKNPENIAGYSLLEPLADFSYVKKQGLNGPVWTLLAFDSLAYEIPSAAAGKEQTTREKLIDYILQRRNEQGCWGIGENAMDADMTGMVLQALAPYYRTDETVQIAIEDALQYLSETQRSDGSFISGGAVSPEGCAQMITALASLNIHPQSDERFIKNGNSVVDCLLGFSVEGGFEHTQNDGYNQMSTEQAFYSLTAFNRMAAGKTALYDMTDLLMEYDVNLDGSVNVNDATLAQRFIAELSTPTYRQLKVMRANRAEDININYVTALQSTIAS